MSIAAKYYPVPSFEEMRGGNNTIIINKVAPMDFGDENFSNLFIYLWGGDLDAKRMREKSNKEIRQAGMKRAMTAAYYRMLRNEAKSRQEEMENEACIIYSMLKKFSEDEAKEKLQEERRRLRSIHHQSFIVKRINEKMKECDDERDRQLETSAEETRREQYRKRVVQEARRRLLEVHASKLLSYYQFKTVESTDDYRLHQDGNTKGKKNRDWSV